MSQPGFVYDGFSIFCCSEEHPPIHGNRCYMASLNQQLVDLFQASDGLLLPDESALQKISIKQGILKVWKEEIVLQGLVVMKDFIQDLASQNKGSLTDSYG